jgi:arylsulfatase A-like enzyme
MRLLLAFLLCLLTCVRAESAEAKPNIVLILADDMGYSDIGCFGGEICTPNIDRLAAEGLRFTQFYNMCRCCPTRAALLTGLYPHQAGMGHMADDRNLGPHYQGHLNEQCRTLAEVLRSAGYRTALVGKWHVTSYEYRDPKVLHRSTWPLQRGFDSFYGTMAGSGSYFSPPAMMRGNEFLANAVPPEFYLTDAISNEAVQQIDQWAGKGKPLFLYVGYTAPHWPLHAPAADIAAYHGMYDVGWDAIRQARLRRQIELNIVDPRWQLTPRDATMPDWEHVANKAWESQRMAAYAAQVSVMDRGIGRILAALGRSGELDNTLLFFLSDNGGCAEIVQHSGWFLNSGILDGAVPQGQTMHIGNDPGVMPGPADTFASYGVGWANASNTPFRLYKHWVHEGGIATPLVVHWPAGIKARNALRRQTGTVLDIMATCVDVAAAEYPREIHGQAIVSLEGKSLRAAFDDRPIDRGPMFWEHEGNRAARLDQWKLVAQHDRPWELYDMNSDRSEMHDLAAEQPDRVRQLSQLYQQWAERVGVLPWPPKRKTQPR